jgi:hypothetical protein
VVELACLENKCASNGTEGSNPSLSANYRSLYRRFARVYIKRHRRFMPPSPPFITRPMISTNKNQPLVGWFLDNAEYLYYVVVGTDGNHQSSGDNCV